MINYFLQPFIVIVIKRLSTLYEMLYNVMKIMLISHIDYFSETCNIDIQNLSKLIFIFRFLLVPTLKVDNISPFRLNINIHTLKEFTLQTVFIYF